MYVPPTSSSADAPANLKLDNKKSTQKNPEDVVITLATRTPLAKGFKGGLKDTELDYILYTLLKDTLEKSKVDPKLIEDVCCGNVSFKAFSSYYGVFYVESNILTPSRSTTPAPRTNSAPPPSQPESPTPPAPPP